MILDKENLDAVLRDWPAPGVSRLDAEQADDDAASPRAAAITRAVTSAARADASALAALLAAPALDAEPGEPPTILKEAGGDKKMAQDNETGEPKSSVAPSGVPAPVPSERKRTSLKAMAERANQAGSRPSSAGIGAPSSRGSTIPPSATSLPLSGSGRSSVVPLARPVEAKSDDSGVVNLNQVKESATPAQIAAAEKAKPGQVDLFDDDRAPATAVSPVAQVAAPTPITAAPKKGNGAVIGAVIAALGLAAAFAISQRKPPVAPTVAETRPTPTVAAPAPTQAAPVETVAAATPTPSAEPTAIASADPATKVALGGPLPTGANAGAAAAATAAPTGESGKVAAATPTAAPTGKVGDLQSEMERAAGAKNTGEGAVTPEPAAGNAKNQNIPEQPSQGSVQAAVGTVMGGAKGCVAGADDVSRANVTFGSAGAVSSVSVTGWAAAHGKTACVQAALKGAKVGAFSKPSYTVGVTIRP